MKNMIIVSACLAGENCRYDGNSCGNTEVIDLLQNGLAVSVCPEQLGGLSTPRPAAEKAGNKIVTIDGIDVTESFNNGARKALEIAQRNEVTKAIVKENSPMCGYQSIYDGTFKHKLKTGSGVFTQLLVESGIEVESR